jgi:TfoX/Sxy family transcriptional regulator of competence genes
MFGGIAFLERGNMCCGVTKDLLMLRLGSRGAELALRRPHVREMDFTGKPLKGMVYVEPEGTRSEADLKNWLDQALSFAEALPENPRPKKRRTTATG